PAAYRAGHLPGEPCRRTSAWSPPPRWAGTCAGPFYGEGAGLSGAGERRHDEVRRGRVVQDGYLLVCEAEPGRGTHRRHACSLRGAGCPLTPALRSAGRRRIQVVVATPRLWRCWMGQLREQVPEVPVGARRQWAAD